MKILNQKFLKSDESEQIFATGVIALAAKLSKIDGKVTQDEISTFKRIFEFPNSDLDNIKIIQYSEGRCV